MLSPSDKLTHRQLGGDEQLHHIVPECVPVLVQETLHTVPHLTRIVLDAKLHGGEPGSDGEGKGGTCCKKLPLYVTYIIPQIILSMKEIT